MMFKNHVRRSGGQTLWFVVEEAVSLHLSQCDSVPAILFPGPEALSNLTFAPAAVPPLKETIDSR